MKIKMILTLTLIGQMAFANFSSAANQRKFVENHAKETRREMHVNGYEDVQTSSPQLMSKASLNNHYKQNSTFVNPPSREEYAQLYTCLSSRSCALWYYESSSSMYGGTGMSGHFILLSITSNKVETITHSIYEE